MLTEQDFAAWAARTRLPEVAQAAVAHIRTSGPSRRVGGGRSNIIGRYPSKKMGVTIQFESHRVELPAIFELEHNYSVLEYYDQVPSIISGAGFFLGTGTAHAPPRRPSIRDRPHRSYTSGCLGRVLANGTASGPSLAVITNRRLLAAHSRVAPHIRSAQLSLGDDDRSRVRAPSRTPAPDPGA